MTPAERIAELEGLLAQKEIDRQYHMNCINHLAASIGALGEKSETVIETAIKRLAQAQADKVVAETDNTALLEELSASNESLCSDSAEERRKRWDYVADVVFEQPHPGTALLDELARLRELLKAAYAWRQGHSCFTKADCDRVHETLVYAIDRAMYPNPRGPARSDG